MKKFADWLKRYRERFRVTPLSPPQLPVDKELEEERRRHLEEQKRLRRLEYLYYQQRSIGQQGEGERGQ